MPRSSLVCLLLALVVSLSAHGAERPFEIDTSERVVAIGDGKKVLPISRSYRESLFKRLNLF